jgi:hypothetical protein
VRKGSDHGLREMEVDGSQHEPLGSVVLKERSDSTSGVRPGLAQLPTSDSQAESGELCQTLQN